MNNRVTSNSGNAVSLFPFLAVLLCTMGALLVLLVVLAQRAGEQAVAEAESAPIESASFEQEPELPDVDVERVNQLALQLKVLRSVEQKLAIQREQADKRLRAEQDKLTHLEEHTRRLEHEVAKLAIAAEQLKAAEENQAVDQQQAERELKRLKALIAEKKALVEQLREEPQGERTYAIMPFLGKDGTVVPRIYIECCKRGVIVQPEGTLLDEDDFFDPNWSGNPLLQVVRATQQHLQAAAAATGQPTPPLPLPLMIVRPDGIAQFGLARQALEASEVEYGYEFVGGDQPLTYPVPIDPALANKQHQARMIARQQLVFQIRNAPSLYKARLQAAAASSDGIGTGPQAARTALIKRLNGNGHSTWDGSGEGSAGSAEGMGNWSDGLAENQDQTGYGSPGDALGMSEQGKGEANRYGPGTNDARDSESQSLVESRNSGNPNGQASQQVVGGKAGSGGSSSTPSNSGASPSAQSDAGNENDIALAGEFREPVPKQAEGSHGTNAPIKSNRNAVPMQRPIKLVVRNDQFTLMPSRHVTDSTVQATTISTNQSTRDIGEQLQAALRTHMAEWGIAGRGLYWKPVFWLEVEADATQNAVRLAKLLTQSGLKVELPDRIRVSMGGSDSATQ